MHTCSCQVSQNLPKNKFLFHTPSLILGMGSIQQWLKNNLHVLTLLVEDNAILLFILSLSNKSLVNHSQSFLPRLIFQWCLFIIILIKFCKNISCTFGMVGSYVSDSASESLSESLSECVIKLVYFAGITPPMST